jgi:glucose-1-phosphate cytidylyltransferase
VGELTTSRRYPPLKVVLFCGGLGLRMGTGSKRVPKPMIQVGDRPILWHIMKYYASFGFNSFVFCLGHRAEVIKEYFLAYNEALSNDFVLRDGGRNIELLGSDITDWSITFVNTGLKSVIGQRLKSVERHIGNDEFFLATYGDGLTDAPLTEMIDRLVESDKVGIFLAARPTAVFHFVKFDERGTVQSMSDLTGADLWINAGYFVFRREIFDYIRENEDLVEEPFQRLIAEEKLIAYPYEGFWAPMDTLKDKQLLDSLVENGRAPWALWEPLDAPSGEPVSVIT